MPVNANPVKPRIVLASSSFYRRTLLQRAGLDFLIHAPQIDESVLPGETGNRLVQRLAEEKARALATLYPDALIIGSDQIADCRGELFGKPRDRDDAIRQLQMASNSTVILHTGLALLNTRTGDCQVGIDTYQVIYRSLEMKRIEAYLDTEKPYDCCGSLKVEGPGIALIRQLIGNDPNTLMGLPVLMLIEMLEREHAGLLPV